MYKYILYALICLVALSGCVGGMQKQRTQNQAQQAMVNRDFAAAAQLYVELAQSEPETGKPGSPVAQYWLATFLFYGTGVSMDRGAAVQWMGAAADAQYAPAMLALGLWKISGQAGPADAVSGARLVSAAAAQSLPEAMMVLGALTAQGVGVPKDTARAQSFFSRAHALGYPVPQALLTPQGVARLAANK